MTHRIVKVEWLDASGGIKSGWRPTTDIRKGGKPAPAVSVGFLLTDDENAMIVCPHLVGENLEDGDGEVVIPKSWVVKVTDLVDKPKRR